MRLLGGYACTTLALLCALAACSEANTPRLPSVDGGDALAPVDPNDVPVNGSLAGVGPTVDTDGDGTPDVQEGTGDSNNNGIPAHLDPDPADRPTTGSPTTGTPVGTLDAGSDTDPILRREPDGCGVVSAESQFERTPVDVVWAIDNSGSMLDDFLNVAAGMGNFTNSVAASGANIRVVIVSANVFLLDASVHEDTERYLVRPTDVQSTNAFRVLLADYANYSSFLRPEAATHVIVVTDDTSDMSKDEFRPMMESRLGKEFYFHAIAPDPAVTGGLGLGLHGTAYYDLAQETGGETLPITSSDWSSIFERLESAIVQTAQLPCQVKVPDAEGRDLDNVQVLFTPPDGSEAPFPKAESADQCGDAQAWHYDDNDAPSQIVLCPAACDGVEEGGNLDVVFACEPPPPLI